jgi:hypothetical protein
MKKQTLFWMRLTNPQFKLIKPNQNLSKVLSKLNKSLSKILVIILSKLNLKFNNIDHKIARCLYQEIILNNKLKIDPTK